MQAPYHKLARARGRSCSISSSCSMEPLLTSIQYRTGVVFKGYIASKSRGKGSFKWASGLSYSGEFKEDKREGYGKLSWPDGSSYEGYFHNDVREGHGKHTWGASREVYEGKYHNDKRHGKGVYTWPSGASFKGTFKEDLKNGLGLYTSPQGEKFEGTYKDDMRCGEGVYSYHGGRQDVGIWKGQKLIRLKFVISEIIPSHKSRSLPTPDMHSRGKHGPKGYLEIASQEFILNAVSGDFPKIKAILENGAVHVDVVDKHGRSALFASAVNGNPDVVNYLLDNGADVNQMDDGSISVLNACHHVCFSSHPKVKVLIDKLQAVTKHPLMSAQSGSLSSASDDDDGDTETLFTSDFEVSTPQIHSNADGKGSNKILGPAAQDLDFLVDTTSHLVRARSLVALNQLGSLVQASHLLRHKSFPMLKCHGDKHVRFQAGLTSHKIDLMSSEINLKESKETHTSSSSSSKAHGIDTVKSKEIYVAYALQPSSRQLHYTLSSTNDSKKHDEHSDKHDYETTSTPEFHPNHLSTQVHKVEGEESLTASANGEIMGISAVNSDISTDPDQEDSEQPLGNPSQKMGTLNSRLSSKSDLNLPAKSNTVVEDNKLPSLPDLSQGRCSPGTGLSTTTPASVTTRPPTCYSRPGSVKASPLSHFKKHLSKPPLCAEDLHGSSVFSSTRYGPIVSAAQSTTLSYVESDQDVTDSSSAPSITLLPVAMPEALTLTSELSSLIMLLLSRGASPNVSTIPLQPIFYSVLVGEVEVAKKLLESGARTDECLPDELGGYSLLHMTMGTVGPHSPSMVELFLQYGADPNSGGSRIDRGGPQRESGDEEAEEWVTNATGDTTSGELVAGRNEGNVKVTPLHVLCGVQVPKSKNREELLEVVPVLINLLVKHGADVNCVANGHSPLALAILKGHDSGIDTLLENGADPNLPLGKVVKNALCALTTHMAHKSRAFISPSNSLFLLQKLMMAGADIFCKVRLMKGGVGTVLDFANAAFHNDRRLSTVKYDSLSRSERACYRSAKRVITHLRNLFRCKALQNLAIRSDLHNILQTKLRDTATSQPSFEMVIKYKRRNSTLSSSTCTSSNPIYLLESQLSGLERNVNAEPQLQGKTSRAPMVWLPEITLTVSINAICRVTNQEVLDDKEQTSTERRRIKPPRLVRYKELLDKTDNILSSYTKAKLASAAEDWSFSSFCYECGRSYGTCLTECPGCRMVAYCSKNCKRENWRKGHREECNKSDSSLMISLSPTKPSRMAQGPSTSATGAGPVHTGKSSGSAEETKQ